MGNQNLQGFCRKFPKAEFSPPKRNTNVSKWKEMLSLHHSPVGKTITRKLKGNGHHSGTGRRAITAH